MTSRWVRCGWLVAVVVLALLMTTLVPRSVLAQATPIAAAGPHFTPLLQDVLTPPDASPRHA